MDEQGKWREELLNWQILSKNRNMLFGVAILWIMVFHSTNFSVISNWEGFDKISGLFVLRQAIGWGGAGVDIFLFLSGIGLWYSFSRTPDLLKFYGKRLKRVLIPYLIYGVVFWWIVDVRYQEHFGGFFEDLFWVTYYQDGVDTIWYINFALIMYLFFPLFYYLLAGRYRQISMVILMALSFGLIYIMYNYYPDMYNNIEKSVARIPIFLLGCYWGKLVKSRKPMREGWVLFALVIPWVVGFVQYFCDAGFFPWLVAKRFWYALLAIALCILLSLLFSVVRMGIVGKFVNLAGVLSLELYLSHICLQRLLQVCYPDYKNWSMTESCQRYILVVLVLGFALAVVYHMLSVRVGKFFRRLKEKKSSSL